VVKNKVVGLGRKLVSLKHGSSQGSTDRLTWLNPPLIPLNKFELP
jgi:hypothetical protein